MASWELGNRSYIREKVISLYERVFAARTERGAAYVSPPEDVWRLLFLLKVNRLWLQQRVLAMSEDEVLGPYKPLLRDLFARCIAQLGSKDAESVAHALETASVVLGALGHKSFLDPASDTLEVFCGVQQVESTMGALLGALRSALSADDAERCRAALTCALSFGCLTTNINQNILLEFLMHEEFAAAAFGVLLGANAEIDSPALREQALKMVVLFGAYQKYESRNPFRRKLQAAATPAELARLIAPCAALLAGAASAPTAPTADAASDAAGGGGESYASQISGTLYWMVQRGLEALTLDELLPGAGAGATPDAVAERAALSQLLAAALCAHEAIAGSPAALGGAFFTQLEAGGKADGAGATLSAPSADRESAHCATTRLLVTAASLGALHCGSAATVALTRVSLLALLTAASSAKALEAFHAKGLGGDLTLWRVERGAAVARRTTRHATLAGAQFELIGALLAQNQRRTVPAETLHCALLLAQRLLLAQLDGAAKPAELLWPPLWASLLSSLLHCAAGASLHGGDTPGGWVGLLLQHLLVVNLVLIHGAAILPQPSLQQQCACEIVRRHAGFERLFKEAKRRDESGKLVGALALIRRIIVLTFEKLPPAPADGEHSQAELLDALRKVQLEIDPQMAAAVQRWQLPAENPTHVSFFQSVSRQLITAYRADSTLHFRPGEPATAS